MLSRLTQFEAVVRRAHEFTTTQGRSETTLHPFDVRNIHPGLPAKVRALFDDGHFAEATFEAFKFVDKQVQKFSQSHESGFKLMMQVFAGNPPAIALSPMTTTTEQDEQKGYQFLFAGSALAIRNPRGHEYTITDDPDKCLDHLVLASMLIRRLDDAGFK
jgi:uncharacterized protein (TIGR02391 family)